MDDLINIKRIRIKNFRGYGENPNDSEGVYEFDNLNTNMVLISGRNGFGKTSLFEAIEWCITDSVSRLKQLIDTYGVNGLRNKHYLKFFSKNDSVTRRNEREVLVEIGLDNGVILKRVTKCNILKLSDSSGYSSRFYLDGTELDQVEASKELSKILLNSDLNNDLLSNILNSNFLGQESINAFLRDTKPDKRKATLAKLLSFEQIEKISESATALKNSRKLSGKRNRTSERIDELEKLRDRLAAKFSNLNLDSAESYISKLNSSLHAIKSQLEFGDTLDVELDNNLRSVQKFDYDNALTNTELIEGYTRSYKAKLESIADILSDKEKLIKQIVNHNHLDQYCKCVKSVDILKFLCEFDELSESKLYEEIINKVTEEKEALANDRSLLFSKDLTQQEAVELGSYVDKNNNIVNDLFWRNWNHRIKQLISLFSSFGLSEGEVLKYSQRLNEQNINFEELEAIYNDLASNRTKINEDLALHVQNRNQISSLNKDYSKLLESVKVYIIKNYKEIKQCPVCLNDTFNKEKYCHLIGEDKLSEPVSDILGWIIDRTISNGNSVVQEKEEAISKLQKALVDINYTINQRVITIINNWLSLTNEIYKQTVDNILILVNGRIEKREENIKSLEQTLKMYQGRMKKYTDMIKVYLDRDAVTKEDIVKRLSEVETNKARYESELFANVEVPSVDDLEKNIADLKCLVMADYDDGGLGLLAKEKSDILSKQSKATALIALLDSILSLKLQNDSDYDSLKQYNELAKTIISEKQVLSEIIEHESVIDNIIKDTNEIYEEVVEKILKNHHLINWIYEFINPHPHFKSAHLSLDNSKGIIVTDDTGKICLDHIYSSAQLNVLALSIFLGVGLNERFSNLGQLFLDDPIQSMDDIKIHSFIDLLRGVLDSRLSNKKIMLSTHDDNFAKLLSIKMRNRQLTHYRFEGYFEEGPKYRLL